MADANKRYYWLKLPEDFFRQKEIKQLRKIAGGDVHTIIYLKMLLRSLKDDGKLFFDGIDKDFASELALDIDEDVENVRLTVSFLMAKGLLVQGQPDEYNLPAANAMTGSEGYSAERMRRHRENKRIASHCDALVTDGDASVTHGDALVITSDEEIEIRDRDRDRDRARERSVDEEEERAREYNPFGDGDIPAPKIDTVQKYAMQQLTAMGVRAMEEMNSFVEDLSEDIVRHAIDNALDNGKRTWAYVRAILNGYVDAGVRSVGEAEEQDAKHRQRASVAETPPPPKPPKPAQRSVGAPIPLEQNEEPKKVRRQVTLKGDDNRLVGLLYEDGEIVVIQKEGRFTHADVGPFGMKRINISGYRSVKRWEDATCDPGTQLSDFFP